MAVQGIPKTEAGALGEAGIPEVYDLQGRQLWSRPEAGAILGFLAPDRLFAYHLAKKGKLAGFDTVDIHTGVVTPWIAEPHGRVAALDPAGHRIAVFSDADESKTLILDYPSGRILQSLKNQTRVTGGYPGGFPFQFFAEDGKTLCSVETIDRFDRHPTCNDVETGKPVAEFSRSAGWRDRLRQHQWLAHGAQRTHLSAGVGRAPIPFRGRAVWDFRTDSEVASWGPPGPQVAWLATQGSGVPITPVTISATGRYVAESFGTELRIYQIP